MFHNIFKLFYFENVWKKKLKMLSLIAQKETKYFKNCMRGKHT